MRNHQVKNQLPILCLVVGFFIGIVYQNVMAKTEITMLDLFLESNLKLYLETNIMTNEYALFVIKERLVLFSSLLLLGCLKWKRLVVIVLLLLLGFFVGTIVVLSVLQLKVLGILICLVGILPQGIFYGTGVYVLLAYWYHYPMRRWNYVKTGFVILMIGVGIMMEVYVNPIALKWVIEWIV